MKLNHVATKIVSITVIITFLFSNSAAYPTLTTPNFSSNILDPHSSSTRQGAFATSPFRSELRAFRDSVLGQDQRIALRPRSGFDLNKALEEPRGRAELRMNVTVNGNVPENLESSYPNLGALLDALHINNIEDIESVTVNGNKVLGGHDAISLEPKDRIDIVLKKNDATASRAELR